VRIHGSLLPLECSSDLTDRDVHDLIAQLLTPDDLKEAEEAREYDGAITLASGIRLRINIYQQSGALAAVLRLLPSEFFPLDQLGIPAEVCTMIITLQQGLVLVTGATGSGKTTTIASLVNEINRRRPLHIHTIEDPVEYVHRSCCSFVTQREVGRDTSSFAEASRRSLRQDPDVVVIGEMRDIETMATALTLAETGHLTFATLHTADAVQTVSRVISAFPAQQQPQIRIQLANTLSFAICQKLIPQARGSGRSLAAEVLVATQAVRALIRENKTHQLRMTMQTSHQHNMRTMNQSLACLVAGGLVNRDTALAYSDDAEELIDLISQA
jgi:twitching motility protein PilT